MKHIRIHILFLIGLWVSNYSFSQEYTKHILAKDNPKVRFAILADRTGGEERGVFNKVIEQINTLSPDFVVSIGDVIDGYTTDESYLNGLWSEFDSLKKAIQVPFYIAPGNHDVSNPWMEKQWKKRFGCTYQALEVNDDLLLFLNTDDGGASCISQQQVDYFRRSLNEYKKNGWIYLFMHRPLWKYGEKGGCEKIEELLLQKKNVIVFSGHEHHYVMNNRNGRKYYMLSTSGGGNNLRSNSLGEFHHFFFVTMDKEEPKVSNILLNGIMSERVVNELNEKTVSVMRNENWFQVKPTLLQDNKQQRVSTQLLLNNDATVSVRIKGKLPFDSLMQFVPSKIDTVIPAQSKATIALSMLNNSGVDLLCTPINISLEACAKVEKDAPEIVTHVNKEWVFDVVRMLQNNAKPDWIDVRPGYIKEDWDWKGDHDGRFRFSFSADKRNLILEIDANDDCLILDSEDPRKLQDKFFVKIASAEGEQLNNAMQIICIDGNVFVDDKFQKLTKIKGTVSHSEGKLNAKLIIPKSLLGNEYHRIRLNVGFMDHDNKLNTKPSVLWWNTLWQTEQENNHSGIFLLNN